MAITRAQLQNAVTSAVTGSVNTQLTKIVGPIVNASAGSTIHPELLDDAATSAAKSRADGVHTSEVGEEGGQHGDPREDSPSSGRPLLGDPPADSPSEGGSRFGGTGLGQTATSTSNIALANSCTARPQGASGSPATPASYGGDGSAAAGYDPNAVTSGGTVEQGKMTDADYDSLKYYKKGDFGVNGGDPYAMQRGEVFAADRLSTCYGSRVPFTSGHRSSGHNAAVHGASGSQHIPGNALDFNMDGMGTGERQKLLNCAFDSGFSGFGFYGENSNMLHLDQGPGRFWSWSGGDRHAPLPSWSRDIMDKKYQAGMKPSGGGATGTGDTGAGSGDIGATPIKDPQPSGGPDTRFDTEILARTIWGEARGQGTEGMTAVAAVIRNRLKSGKWPKDLPACIANVCLEPAQFSCWNAKGPGGNRAGCCGVSLADDGFRPCVDIAKDYVNMAAPDPTGGATYFKAPQGNDSWQRDVVITKTIGSHTFYKAKGA